MIIEALIRLICEYQAKVQEAVELFELYKGLQRPHHRLDWKFSGLLQSGYLDSEGQISYFLHGSDNLGGIADVFAKIEPDGLCLCDNDGGKKILADSVHAN